MAIDTLFHPARQSDLLLFRLYRIHATAGAKVVRICEQEAGLTRRQWRVLGFAVQHEGSLSSELATYSLLDRARTSRALKELESKGLVLRRPRSSNLKEVQIFVTDKGRSTHHHLFARAAEVNQQLLKDLSESERVLLDSMLARLQSQANTLVNFTVGND